MKKTIYFSSIFLLMICSIFGANNPDIDEFDLLEISLEDLDELDSDQSLSFSQKMDALFSLISFQAAKTKQIAGEKLEVAKNHISEHQKAYALGLAAGTAATVSFIVWLNRHKFFSAQIIT